MKTSAFLAAAALCAAPVPAGARSLATLKPAPAAIQVAPGATKPFAKPKPKLEPRLVGLADPAPLAQLVKR